MKMQGKKFLAMLLTVCMVLSLLPAGALAQEEIIPVSPDSFVQEVEGAVFPEETTPEETTPEEDAAVETLAAADHVVINEVYGGGGNKNALLTHDFIELYNPTNTAVSLDGWTVQLLSGSDWKFGALTGSIAANSYYLVRCAAGTTVTDKPIETFNVDASALTIGGTGFSVALSKGATAITGKDDTNVVDLVGAGSGKVFEGTVASAPSNTTAVVRNDPSVDTDNNSADFKIAAPEPNSGTVAPITQVATPKAAPAAGAVIAGTKVALTCATKDAKIYYTTDDSEPTAESTPYTEPIAITEPITIKAIGIDPAGTTPLDPSAVLTAEYTILDKMDISVARKLKDGEPAAVEGIVIADYNGTDMKSLGCYIQDATGGIMLYDSNDVLPADLKVGDKLKVTGSAKLSSGKQEIEKLTAAETGTATVTPAVITVADINTAATAEAKEGTLVTLVGLTVTKKVTDSYKTCILTLSDGSQNFEAKLDNRRPSFAAGALEATLNIGDAVTVVGYIESLYNDKDHIFQLRGAGDVTVTTPCTIVQPPVSSVASGAFVPLSSKVPLTCATPGATFEFNTTAVDAADDVWKPVPEGGLVMPATRQNYTVYVRAIKADFTTSTVVTLNYAVGLAARSSIRAVRSMAKDTEVFIQGDIIGDAGSSFYVQDATGGIAVNTKLEDLQKLAGLEALAVGMEVSIRAKVVAPFNGLLQIKVAEPLTVGDVLITNATPTAPTPIPVTVAMLNSGHYQSRLVALSQVTLASNAGTGMKNHNILQNGTECTFRANIAADKPTGTILNIVGVASTFNASQLLQQKGETDNGITTATPDSSTVGDPIVDKDGFPNVVVWSAPAPKTPVPADNKWTATEGLNMAGAELSTGGGAALIETSGKGYNSNSWDKGAGTKYWQITFSTLGVSDITVSAKHSSSNTGPCAYLAQYSVGDGAFTEVPGGFVDIVYTKTGSGSSTYEDSSATTVKLPLPADTTNQAKVTVRWVLDSNEQSADPTKEIGSGGTNQLNAIAIGGNEYYAPGTVAPVKPTPAAGAVPAHSTVTLATPTAGTTIRYTIDGTVPTATTGTVYDAPIALATLPATIKAVAYKTADPTKISPLKEFVFTQAKVAQVACNKLDGSKINPAMDIITFSAAKGIVIKYTLTTKFGTSEAVVGAETTYVPADPLKLTAEQFPVRIEVRGFREDYSPSDPTVLNFTLGSTDPAKNYFGQLHSHTAENSDGAGTLEDAFKYAAEQSGVDFLAVTDHSNSFDKAPGTDTPDIYNLNKYNADNAQWVKGHTMADKYTTDSKGTFVGMYGYEMTWSGGPGHINTYATEGFVSRNNSLLNSKTNDKGMRAYYELLSRPESAASISQFNHPGTTFGNFTNFGYYDPIIDSRISLVEVGNGEGAIGSGGYFPSYSEYTLALDKGWHVAPTNNQDNHKGHWGDANDARSVAYTNDFTRDGIYQAMRDMRVYATEDKNLDVVYTLNGAVMGTVLPVVPATADFKVVMKDADAKDKISKVEIVTIGGSVVHKVEDINTQTYTLEHTISAPIAGYYYIRVTEADKDIAVSAPIWLGAAPAVGMSELTTDTYMVVKDEKFTTSLNLFNNEDEAVTLTSLTYTNKATGAVLSSTATPVIIAPKSTIERKFSYSATAAGSLTILATAQVTVYDAVKTYTAELTLEVKDPNKLLYVGVDGSHYNEYVAGNYKDSMGNFSKLAGEYDVRVNILRTSQDLIAAMNNPKYKMMVFTAPTRRLEGITYASYSDAELAAVTAFAAKGGTVVVAGWGDYYESYDYCPKEPEMQMAAQQNKLLKAIGSTLRLADDEAKDNTNNPGKNAARLYLSDHNGFKSPLLAGVDHAQVWSQYGGSTVFAVDGTNKPATTLPGTVTPVISGYGTLNSDGTGKPLNAINSEDDDKDGYGIEMDNGVRPPKYTSDNGPTSLLVATETVAQAGGKSALVVVSGGAFMSDFEIKADVENAGSLNYSNYNFLANLVESLNPPTVSTIQSVTSSGKPGDSFTIEGRITSNAAGYDENTSFFDCSYLQDATGGINVFPVAGNYRVGQKLRISGTVSAYQGEIQLAVKRVKLLDANPGEPMAAKKVSTREAATGAVLGQLVKIEGVVVYVADSQGVTQTIMVRDDSGYDARVFIDGYITKDKDAALKQTLALGNKISVTGLASYDDTFDGIPNRIRIRDRADIVCTSEKPVIPEGVSTAVITSPLPGFVTWEGAGDCTFMLDGVAFADPDNTNKVAVTGALAYKEGFKGFWPDNAAMQSGHFLGLRLMAQSYQALAPVLTYGDKTITMYDGVTEGCNPYYDFIQRIDTTKPTFTITVDLDGVGAAYSATTYSFDMSDLTLTPKYEPPTGGSTPKPVAPNPEAPPTIVKPDVSVSADGASASTSVSNTELNNAVKEANKAGSTSIVIDATPAKDGEKVTSATVKLPQSALATAGKNKNLAITVNTSVAGVTLPNAAVAALGKESNVAITAAKGENGTVTVSVTAGDKTLDTVKGGLVATIPAEKPAPGLVAVLVKADGTEEIIPKSALTATGIAALLDGSATIRMKDNAKPFADTTAHWAKNSIAAASARELLRGVSATAFAPDAKTSRGMVVTVLHRLEHEIAASGKAPDDVPAGSYYADASAWALEQKITSGDGSGNFAGDRDITVGELATMVYNYARAMGLNTKARAELTGFKDADAIQPWATDAFSWGVAAGIFSGTDTGNLNPGSTATRAQLSVVCQHIIELFLA